MNEFTQQINTITEGYAWIVQAFLVVFSSLVIVFFLETRIE